MSEETKTVTLTVEEWQQVLGMLEQGTSVILSQLALQQDGIDQVAKLASIASTLKNEIKQQLQ
jgi:hypothetical protein